MRIVLFVFVLSALAAAGDEDKGIYPLRKGGLALRLQDEVLSEQPGYQLNVSVDGSLIENGKVLPVKLTVEQLQALLRFADRECRLFEYDAKAVRRALGPGPLGCGVGSVTTVIAIHLRGKEKIARIPQLRASATRLPNNKSLQRMLALDRRLRLEGRLARHGGRKEVERWLGVANARLKVRFPKERPFNVEDFQETREVPPEGEAAYPPGRDPNDRRVRGRCATFTRREESPQRILTAIVTTDEKPLASVNLQR